MESTFLNNTSFDLPDQQWYRVSSQTSYIKQSSDTEIELSVGTYITVDTVSNGFGVWFELRLEDSNGDPIEPDFKDRAALNNNSGYGTKWVNMKSVYEDLPAGTYTFTIYAQAPNANASASGIIIDSGGWLSRIILKEL